MTLLISPKNRKCRIDATTLGGVTLNGETMARWALPRLGMLIFTVVVGVEDGVYHFLLRHIVGKERRKLTFPLASVTHFYICRVDTGAIGFVSDRDYSCIGRVDATRTGVIASWLTAAIDFAVKDVPQVNFGFGR